MSILNPYIKSTKQLFLDGKEVVSAEEIVTSAGEGWNHSRHIKSIHASLRTIRNELIREHNLYSHTISADYTRALNSGNVNSKHIGDFIPAGAREVWGLRHVTDKSDPIYIASRDRECHYSGKRLVTNSNRIVDAEAANMLSIEDYHKLLTTAITKIASIEGNGAVTEILSKTLNIRIRIQNL